MIVQFVGRTGRSLCFRHAVLAVAQRGEEVRASVGETTEMGYWCVECGKEERDMAELNERRKRIEQCPP